MKAFKLDEIQTDAILDAQLYKIAQMEIKKILDELKEKKAEAERDRGDPGVEEASSGASSRTSWTSWARSSATGGGRGMAAGRGRAGVRRGSVHRPREHQRRADARRLDQARRPAGVGRGHARPRGRRGHRRRARQHARPRRLLRRRRHRLHDADQRGAGQLRLRRADRQVLQARRPGARSSAPSTTDERFIAADDEAGDARTTRRARTCWSSRRRARRCGRRWRRSAPSRRRPAGATSGSNEGDRVVLATVLRRRGRAIFLASQRRPRDPLPDRGDQHPVRRRQGRDRHQAGRRRRLPGRRR